MPIWGINTYHGTQRLLAGGVPPHLSGYPQAIHRETGVIHRIRTGSAQSYAQGLKRTETAPEAVWLGGQCLWVQPALRRLDPSYDAQDFGRAADVVALVGADAIGRSEQLPAGLTASGLHQDAGSRLPSRRR